MNVREEAETGTVAREYEKPRVDSEEVFETLALACTKADAQCVTTIGDFVAQS